MILASGFYQFVAQAVLYKIVAKVTTYCANRLQMQLCMSNYYLPMTVKTILLFYLGNRNNKTEPI